MSSGLHSSRSERFALYMDKIDSDHYDTSISDDSSK